MAEQDNIQLIQEAYAAFKRGDVQGILNTLAEDVEWVTPGPANILPYAGRRRGHDQVAQFFSALAGAEDTQLFEPQEFIASGDKVVVTGKYGAALKSGGVGYENEWAHVFTLRHGKITRFHEYTDTSEAVELHRAQPARKGQGA